MKAPIINALIAVSLLSSAAAFARDDVGEFVNVDDIIDDGNGDSDPNVPLAMLDPTYSGSGCPDGTASFALTEDRKTLSLLFDSFIAQAGRASGLRRDQKECNIKIPFMVPPGYQAAVTRIDFRGFYSLPRAGRAMLLSSFVFYKDGMPSKNRVVRKKNFSGPLDSDYAVSGSVSSGTVMSECGKNFELRINAHMIAMSNASMDDALASVDSLDAIARPGLPQLPELRYHLKWQKCATLGDAGNGIGMPGTGIGGIPRSPAPPVGPSPVGPRGPNYNPRPRY